MLALISDYGKFRKNLGGLGELRAARGRRPVLVRRGGVWGLGYTDAETVKYCNIPGVGLAPCPGQDLAAMQCQRNTDDENARRAVNLANCLQAAKLNNYAAGDPRGSTACYSGFGPVTANCSSLSSPAAVNAGGFTYTAAPPPAPVPTVTIPVSVRSTPVTGRVVTTPARLPAASRTATPPAGSTGSPTQGGIQPGATPGVTTNAPAAVDPGSTTPAPVDVSAAPGSDMMSSVTSFLTGTAFTVAGYGIPWWGVIAVGAGVGLMVAGGGHRR